jgi:hypothetical protein
VIDTASVTEADHIAGNNVWSTSTAGGKVNCSTVAAGDGIHPSTTEATNIAAALQPQYNAAMAAPMPEPPVSNNNEDEDTMTIDSSNDFAVTTAWAEVTVAAEKQFRFGFHGEGQRLWWRIASTSPSAGAVGDVAKSGDTQFADTVATGKKLWVRTDNPFTVVVHVAA